MSTTIATIELDSNFPAEFTQYVITAIAKKIKLRSARIKESLTKAIKNTVQNRLVSSHEYGSIAGGRLTGELGVPQADARIAQVVETWVNGIQVNIKTGTDPFLFIDIGMLKKDYGDVLGLGVASYTYHSRRGGGEIPWLEWLLLEGDRRIINRYEFTPNITKGSRTGMGIMVEKARGFWQVPSDVSGTAVDNFATRALDKIEIDIDKIIERILGETFT